MAEFKGYRAAFNKAGQTLKEVTSFSACPECGMPMEVKQSWRKGLEAGRTTYQIQGLCPKGHQIERYGFGEVPTPAVRVASNGDPTRRREK